MYSGGLNTIGRDNIKPIVDRRDHIKHIVVPSVRSYFGADVCYLALYCHPLVHIVHSSTVVWSGMSHIHLQTGL